MLTDSETVADTTAETVAQTTDTSAATEAEAGDGILDEINDMLGTDPDDAGEGEAADAGEATDEATETAAADDAAADGTDKPAENEPTETKPAPKAPAAADPKELERQQQEAAAYTAGVTEFQNGYTKLQKVLADGTYDAFEHGPEATKTLMKGLELVAGKLEAIEQHHAKATEAEQTTKTFQTLATLPEYNGVAADKLQARFNVEWETIAAEEPEATPDQIKLAATRALKAWAKTIKGQVAARDAKGVVAKPKPPIVQPKAGRVPVRTPTVTPGGARAMPRTTGTRAPVNAPKTVDEKLEAGHYGDLSLTV